MASLKRNKLNGKKKLAKAFERLSHSAIEQAALLSTFHGFLYGLEAIDHNNLTSKSPGLF